jgi:hypothetical protein
MRRVFQAALGSCLLTLLAGLLAATPVSSAALAAAQPTQAERASRGVVVVKFSTPSGVPGSVQLKAGRKERWAGKRQSGTTGSVKLKLPTGRWTVKPQQVVLGTGIFVGSASKRRVTVRSGSRTVVTVTYRAAPSVSDLQVTRLDPTGMDLSWTAPPGDAEYAVRMASGDEPPTSATVGQDVPVTGTTAAVTGLTPAATYAFSVFARTPGTSAWWGPVSTTVSLPAEVNPAAPASVVVTNPATVVVENLRAGDASVTAGGVQATVPAGVVPVPGQPWVLPRSGSLPGGFVGTVTSVAADGSSVALAPAGLADAYDYLDLRVPDLRQVPMRTVARSDGKTAGVASCSGSGAEKFTIDPSFDPFGHFDAKLSKYKILGKNVPVGMSFDVRFGVDVTLSADLTTKATATCKLALPSFLQAVPGTVPMMIRIDPKVNVSASGSVSMKNGGYTVSLGADIDGYVGLGGDDELDADLIVSATPLNPTFEGLQFSVGAKAGVETSVGPGVGNKKAGAMVGLTTALNALDGSLSSSTPGCLDLEANHSASISLAAKAWLGKLSFERTVTVPGLEASNPYPGSPWRIPSTCGGPAEYRITEGTLGVSHSWSGGCSNDQGSCDDGPDNTTSMEFNDTGNAQLVVAEPGPWSPQYDETPAYLTAPMRFSGWDLDQGITWRYSGGGCSSTNTEETVGAVQFGGAFWETAAMVTPGPDGSIDARVADYYWWDEELPWGEWTDGWWWGSLGAWDTDYSNGFPSIQRRWSWTSGGECVGSDSDTYDQPVEYLGPGWWWPYPYESRRLAPVVTATPLGECTEQSCSWRVDGTSRYEFRAQYDPAGYQGSGSATVTWSYVIEKRGLGDPAGERDLERRK